MYPPVCEECFKKNPSAVSYRDPSKVYIHYYSPAQAHFEMIGNPPLKSNSFTAVDFDTVLIVEKSDICYFYLNTLGLYCNCRSCLNRSKWKTYNLLLNGT